MKKNLITTILRSTSAFSLTFALGLTDKLQAQENPSPEESTEETTEHYYLDEYREEPITLLEAGGKMHTLTAYLHVYDGAVYATTAETSSEIITAIVVSQFQESEIKDALAYYRQFEGEGTTVTQGTLILGSDATRHNVIIIQESFDFFDEGEEEEPQDDPAEEYPEDSSYTKETVTLILSADEQISAEAWLIRENNQVISADIFVNDTCYWVIIEGVITQEELDSIIADANPNTKVRKVDLLLSDGTTLSGTALIDEFPMENPEEDPSEEEPPNEEEPPAEDPPNDEEPPAEDPPNDEEPPAEDPPNDEEPPAEDPPSDEEPHISHDEQTLSIVTDTGISSSATFHVFFNEDGTVRLALRDTEEEYATLIRATPDKLEALQGLVARTNEREKPGVSASMATITTEDGKSFRAAFFMRKN